MKKEFKEKLMRGFACGSRRNIMEQHASVSGFWTVRHGVNHPLMFRLLLVRYIIVFFLLLALCITIAFYVGRGVICIFLLRLIYRSVVLYKQYVWKFKFRFYVNIQKNIYFCI